MKEKVLITGASGFVGFHLIEAALRKGLDVYAAVRSTSRIAHLKNLPITFTQVNFSEYTEAYRDIALNKYDYIVHAAGVVKAKDENAYNQCNATFTKTLGLAAAAAHPSLKKFVYVSSLAAMGPSCTTSPITEQDAANPLTYYGKSKLLGEKYLAEIKTLPLITLRPTAVYGPRERDIFTILRVIARGIEPYIGRKAQQLSFVYVKDLAAVTIEALGSVVLKGTYHVSDGEAYDRYALGEITKSILKKKTLKVHIPVALVTAMAGALEIAGRMRGTMPMLNRNKLAELTASNWACSIASIHDELGYTPRYDLQSGLKETLQWYRDHQWLKN